MDATFEAGNELVAQVRVLYAQVLKSEFDLVVAPDCRGADLVALVAQRMEVLPSNVILYELSDECQGTRPAERPVVLTVPLLQQHHSAGGRRQYYAELVNIECRARLAAVRAWIRSTEEGRAVAEAPATPEATLLWAVDLLMELGISGENPPVVLVELAEGLRDALHSDNIQAVKDVRDAIESMQAAAAAVSAPMRLQRIAEAAMQWKMLSQVPSCPKLQRVPMAADAEEASRKVAELDEVAEKASAELKEMMGTDCVGDFIESLGRIRARLSGGETQPSNSFILVHIRIFEGADLKQEQTFQVEATMSGSNFIETVASYLGKPPYEISIRHRVGQVQVGFDDCVAEMESRQYDVQLMELQHLQASREYLGQANTWRSISAIGSRACELVTKLALSGEGSRVLHPSFAEVFQDIRQAVEASSDAGGGGDVHAARRADAEDFLTMLHLCFEEEGDGHDIFERLCRRIREYKTHMEQ